MPTFWGHGRHQQRRDELARKIDTELYDRECGPAGARFIPITAIEDILTEDRLHKLFEKVQWYQQSRVQLLSQHSRIIVAILIRAHWIFWDDLPAFLCPDASFDPASSSFRLNDDCLPISTAALKDFDSHFPNSIISQFDAYQHDLTPVVIRQDTYGKFPKRARLPYTHEPEPIGDGAFGMVYKVTIAKRYLASGFNHRDSNEEDRPMAVKVYKSAGVNGKTFGTNFEQEQSILQKFKMALVNFSAIAKNFAAFVHGNDLNIISDLADMDLAALLAGECLGFETYASNATVFSPRNLIHEVYRLFEAMAWLHEGLSLSIAKRQEVVHMDLKPDNILVFGPFGQEPHPAGQWKIADFNLAEVSDLANPQPQANDRRTGLTLGGMIREKSARPGREAAYLPPELRRKHTLQADKKTDVWSLGCIMADLLAFATGGPAGVGKMHSACISPRDDYFYDVAPSGGAIPKQSFLNWLNGSFGFPRDEVWIQSWRDLITSMLTIDRDVRCSLGSATVANTPGAMVRLKQVYDAMIDSKLGRRRLWAHETLPSTAEQTPSTALSPLLIEQQPRLQESTLPSPGQQIENAMLGVDGGLWSFLKLNFSGTATQTSISPSGKRAAIWSAKSLSLYDLAFRGQENSMWSNKQETVRSQPPLQNQCTWLADDDFKWVKVRFAATYVALLQMNSRGTAGKITLHVWDESQNPRQEPATQITDIKFLSDMSINEQGAILLQFHDRIQLYPLDRPAHKRTLQVVIGSGFTLDGQGICAWQMIGDEYYWHVWDLAGVELQTQSWKWKPVPDSRPDSEQTLIPFNHGHRWAACDIHGRLLLVDPSQRQPVLRRGPLYKFAAGHAMPDDRGLLIVSDRKPQRIAHLAVQSTNLPTIRDLGTIPEQLEIVPKRCSTAVAVSDVISMTPFLFMLHQNGLLVKKRLV